MSTVTRPVVKVVTRSLTYFGSRAKVTTTHHDKSGLGLRTVVTEWIDAAKPENGGHPAGTVTRTVIQGDGWKGAGRTAFIRVEPLTVVSA